MTFLERIPVMFVNKRIQRGSENSCILREARSVLDGREHDGMLARVGSRSSKLANYQKGATKKHQKTRSRSPQPDGSTACIPEWMTHERRSALQARGRSAVF
jgi:hypothetical protein